MEGSSQVSHSVKCEKKECRGLNLEKLDTGFPKERHGDKRGDNEGVEEEREKRERAEQVSEHTCGNGSCGREGGRGSVVLGRGNPGPNCLKGASCGKSRCKQ